MVYNTNLFATKEVNIMEEKKMTEQESLELITRMIGETKKQMGKGGGNPLLLWGYLTIAVSAIVYIALSYTGDPWTQMLWWLLPLIGWPTMIRMRRNEEKRAITFIDRTIGSLWLVLGICFCLIPVYAIFTNVHLPVLFMEAMLVNAGVAITGLIIKYKPVSICGFLGILFSFVFLVTHGIETILIFGGMFGIFMVIPGHLLNAAEKNEIKKEAHV